MSATTMDNQATTRPPALEVRGLRGGYGHYDVLQDIDITLPEGETVGILGPNGAGKTTLLNAIVGLLKNRSGTVRIGGDDVSKLPSHKIGRGYASMVPAGRRLFLDQSVRSNLIIGAYHLRRDKARIAGLLESVHALFPVLEELADRDAAALSGGQQQMVAFGRMLMGDPKLLVLDEPSLGLAPLAVGIVGDALTELRRQGRSVLLVEQRVDLALSTCDRFYLLQGGKIEMEQRVEGGEEQQRAVIDAFLG
jgi:branched-chain amino acid transport system ATP-binding protein